MGAGRVRCDVCAVVGLWELLVLRGGGEVLAISVREGAGTKHRSATSERRR